MLTLPYVIFLGAVDIAIGGLCLHSGPKLRPSRRQIRRRTVSDRIEVLGRGERPRMGASDAATASGDGMVMAAGREPPIGSVVSAATCRRRAASSAAIARSRSAVPSPPLSAPHRAASSAAACCWYDGIRSRKAKSRVNAPRPRLHHHERRRGRIVGAEVSCSEPVAASSALLAEGILIPACLRLGKGISFVVAGALHRLTHAVRILG